MKPRTPVWTREKVIAAIQRWAGLYGRPPKSSEWKGVVRDEGWPSASAVQKYGWANMIEAAGFARPVYNAPLHPEKRAAQGKRPDDRPFPLNGMEAARFGSIVTFENAAGERLVLHETGAVKPSIQVCIDHALTLDETFKVVCVSTPTYVYRDLQGDRLMQRYAHPHFPELSTVPRERMHSSLLVGSVAR